MPLYSTPSSLGLWWGHLARGGVAGALLNQQDQWLRGREDFPLFCILQLLFQQVSALPS